MKEKEKQKIAELIEIVASLPEKDQEKLIWIGQGILIASRNGGNGK